MGWVVCTSLVVLTLFGKCRAESALNCTAQHEGHGCVDPCPPEKTCQNYRNPEPPCLPSMEPCTPKCLCARGFTRERDGGACVPTDQCVMCTGEGEYFACANGPYREDCVGYCRCFEGYERDASNTCVPTTSTPDSCGNSHVPPGNAPSPPPIHNNPTVPVQPIQEKDEEPSDVRIFYNL